MPALSKSDVDDGPLGRRQQHLVDERLVLVAAAVAADSFIRAPGRATLNRRVLAVLVK